MSADERAAAPPSTDPLTAVRQYPWLIVAFAVLFGLLGAWFAEQRPTSYVATAGLLFEDVGGGGRSAADQERYVADQVAILRSGVVAERASALAPTLGPQTEISARDLAANLTVTAEPDSNFVEISFQDGDAETAETGANAIRLAYQQTLNMALAENAQRAVDRLDDAIATTVTEIASLQDRIEAVQEDGAAAAEADLRIGRIVARLAELREPVREATAGSGLEAVQRMATWSDQLRSELNSRLLDFDAAEPLPDSAVLRRRQQDAAALLSDLTLQRSQLQVDAQLAGGGAAFFAPAEAGRGGGVSPTSAFVVMAALGALVGAGIAYVLSQQRQQVGDRRAAGDILGAPLLVDVPASPRTSVEVLGSLVGQGRGGNRVVPLAVIDEPASPQAVAFKVLAGALRRELSEWRAAESGAPVSRSGRSAPSLPDERRGMVLACVSATGQEASTYVAVNVALAAGQSGLRVLLIDGDAGRLAYGVPDHVEAHGEQADLADVIAGSVTLDQAIERIQVNGEDVLSVIRVGRAPTNDPDPLGSPGVGAVIERLAAARDLVIVNLPPVLEAAQATAVQQTDRALAVVQQGTRVSHLHDLRQRMDVMGVPITGYAYVGGPITFRGPARSAEPPGSTRDRTRAPSRSEDTSAEGGRGHIGERAAQP